MKLYLFLLMLTGCATAKNIQERAEPNKIVAHRGAWKNTGSPQNSLASLKGAILLGCAGSETDVHMTADSFIVVNHDPHFFGVDIQNSTLQELQQHRLENGERIPLLSNFLKTIISQNQTKLVIEIKSSQRGKEWAMVTTAKILELVDKFKADDHVLYISFDYDICREVVRRKPDAHVQYLNGDKSAQQVREDGLSGLDYHFSVYQQNPALIQNAKDAGLALNAWTVDDTATIDMLLAAGFDYITTDEPEVALKREKKSPVAAGWKLVWSDEFDRSGLPDESKWSYNVGGHGWGNNEKQFYTERDTANAVVRNGSLFITARNDGAGERKYTSARLVTKGKGEWRYGRVEMRAKLPKGVGLWPAFWMLGKNIDETGWPACGEIDIMEHVGYKPNVILGTVHTDAFNHVKGTQVGEEIAIDKPYEQFHVFAIEWDADKITFFKDDQKYFEFTNKHKTAAEWPFDQPFFIILNLAVGGNLGGAQGLDESAFPGVYEIDYVRVFQK